MIDVNISTFIEFILKYLSLAKDFILGIAPTYSIYVLMITALILAYLTKKAILEGRISKILIYIILTIAYLLLLFKL